MDRRLRALGASGTAGLFAIYAKAGGDRRTPAELEEEGTRRLEALQRRGFDLGYADFGGSEPAAMAARLNAIYENACRALYATLDEHAIRNASPTHARVRTRSTGRDDYLAHPATGETLRPEDEDRVARIYPASRPDVQFVISDGLNANAANAHIGALLPPLRRALIQAGHHVGGTDVVIENGRVRAGYQIGALVGASAIVNLIGERPGTGLDTLSAYLTYGRDPAGRPRWRADMDHACTTAICGIHPRGLPLSDAIIAITRTIDRMLVERRSGVALHINQG